MFGRPSRLLVAAMMLTVPALIVGVAGVVLSLVLNGVLNRSKDAHFVERVVFFFGREFAEFDLNQKSRVSNFIN